MKIDIIICGLGHIGFRCFNLLHLSGKRIAVITDKAPDDWLAKINELGGRVLLGDARNDKLLVQAGIHEASAILAVTDQDLVNVSVVMDAKRLNSSIRTICRLFDGNLGKHLSAAFGINQVLSASEIAAPVFLNAIHQGSSLARSSYQGRPFTLENIDLNQTQKNEPLESDPTAERSMVIAKVGDNRGLLLKTLGKESGSKAAERSRTLLAWISPPALIKFRGVVVRMVLVIAIATAIIKVKMGLAWIDALYFVTTTITTVGYGDFNFSAASPGMKIFGILLMLIGACGIALLFSTLADAFLSERFSNLFGGRNIPRKGHVIIAGTGHIGLRVVEHLIQNRIPVVLLENERIGRFPPELKRKAAVVDGDGRNPETLNRANIKTARAILLLSDNDVENLSTSLTSRSINPKINAVARIFDSVLGTKLKTKLDLDSILSVSEISAPWFVAATLADQVVAAVNWHNQLVIVSEGPSLALSLGSVTLSPGEMALHTSSIDLGCVYPNVS